jgi:hypothetical protein
VLIVPTLVRLVPVPAGATAADLLVSSLTSHLRVR